MNQSTEDFRNLYINARNIWDKQAELEVLIQDQNYDLIGITESWWDNLHDWNNNMKGRRGRGKTREVLSQPGCMYLLEAWLFEKAKTAENFMINNYRGKEHRYLPGGRPPQLDTKPIQ